MSVLTEAHPRRAVSWRKRLLVGAGALLVVVTAGGAAAVYVFDRSQEDRLAAGVRVGGIDVGGMSRAEALATLERRLLPRYRRPLVVQFGRRRFTLDPAAGGLRVDLAGAVVQALAASRRGGFFHRVWRELRSERVAVRVQPRVEYSRAAVRAFARRVAAAVALRPKPARFVPSLTHPRLIPARNGLVVRRQVLSRTLGARLLNRQLPRTFALPTRVVVARPTTFALARRYRVYLAVDRSARRLRLFEHLKLVRTYVIAVGRIGLETPAGLYTIDDKQVNPSWHVPNSPWAGSLAGRVIPPGPDDPLKARWMGFYDGAGIHGTDDLASLGTAASHGCIRMSIPDVEQLYDLVPLHTPIYIS